MVPLLVVVLGVGVCTSEKGNLKVSLISEWQDLLVSKRVWS